MDALVASYASDDDEESSYRPPPKSGLFASLPSARSSSRVPLEPSPKIFAPSASRSSLFRSLPPPGKSNSSRIPSPPRPSRKRVVEFRPAVDMSLLKDDEGDDEERSKMEVKRRAMESEGTLRLSAVLPKPKYSGSVLGGGYASGRCTALEIDDHQPNLEGGIQQEVPSSSGLPGGAIATETYEPSVAVDSGTWENYSSEYTTSQSVEGVAPPYESYPSASLSSEEQYHRALTEPNYGLHPENQTDVFSGLEQQNVGAPIDPLARILMKERHKGLRNGPPTIVEVKQTELTANKIREDQLRSTGIAFGPAYKPASGKAKPSKLHRRKHQIGSLYYDMKQKEAELMERRSKGYMTKAETHAKYGW